MRPAIPEDWLAKVAQGGPIIIPYGADWAPSYAWDHSGSYAVVEGICSDCGFAWPVLMYGETGGVWQEAGLEECPACGTISDGSEIGMCDRMWYPLRAKYQKTAVLQ